MTPLEKVREIIFSRRNSYRRLFNQNNQDARAVLSDLARFCRAHEPTYAPDERTHALLEGRREVWLRLQRQLNLTEEEIWSLHRGKTNE